MRDQEMPSQICDHECPYHLPVSDNEWGLVWRRVWEQGEFNALALIRTQMNELDPGEVRRALAWLTDYFAEVEGREP